MFVDSKHINDKHAGHKIVLYMSQLAKGCQPYCFHDFGTNGS